jgi:3-deoxy-D-manno-octulosonic acid (KDO) 8-phosphate synthase
VVFDATHSVQLPGGQREFVPVQVKQVPRCARDDRRFHRYERMP